MTRDEIRLVIPAQEDFRPIAHLVTGGLALRLDVTYDDLEDVQVAIETLLALRDDEQELVVVLFAEEDSLRAAVGPFPAETFKENGAAPGAGLDLHRVLDAVCDTHRIEFRDDGAWVELTKRIAGRVGSADGESAGARPEDPAALGGGGGGAGA